MEHEPAAYAVDDYRLGRLPSGTTISVPIHRYVGGPGPTAYIQALQHGIELNGPAALRRLHERLLDAEIAGDVVIVPVTNPLAFDHRSYMTPAAYDAVNPNLNRVWPGDGEGSLQERMAARLWDVIADADAVVDLHTGSPDMLEHVRYQAGDADARRLAEAFGTTHLLVDEDDTRADAAFKGRFRTAAARAGIPAVTAELSNSRRVAHSVVERGADGVANVLRALDVLAPAPADPPEQDTYRDDVEHTVAGASGFFEPARDVGVGDHVSAGDELGTVYDPATFAELEVVTAAGSGVVYSLTKGAVVVAGERLAGIAAPVS